MMQPITPDSVTNVHVPPPAEPPKPRRKLLFFDRVKILNWLLLAFVLFTATKHESVPVMTWGDATRDQLRTKWWLPVLIGLEILHQVHLLISERSAGYHNAWSNQVWKRWERFWSKRKPWTRFRMERLVKRTFWFAMVTFLFGALWGTSIVQTVAQMPRRFFFNPWGDQQPWFIQLVLTMSFLLLQFVLMYWFLGRGGVEVYRPEDIKTRFKDVWGQDRVLERVKENIMFLNSPDELEKRGGHVPGGILLWGPPGTGKTLIAEAVAGETSKPFVFVEPGAFKQMFIGIAPMKMKNLFKKVRKLALRHGGVIVFFDEADTLGSRGGGLDGRDNFGLHPELCRHGCNALHYASASMVNELNAEFHDQHPVGAPAAAKSRWPKIVMGGMGGGNMDGSLQVLLTELSGLSRPPRGMWRWVREQFNMPMREPRKHRILFMMATNTPDALDPALLRPGRVDRKYQVTYPLIEGRIKLYDGYFNKIKHAITTEQIEQLALMSSRVSGAEVKDFVNESVIVAMKRGRDTVTWPDVLEARAHKIHGLADGTASSLLERWQTAVHEACHAVAFVRLRPRLRIDIATIEKRGSVGGYVAPVQIEERDFEWKKEKENEVMVFMASLAGERIFFDGDNSVGVGGDMGYSTRTITRMYSQWAMYERVSSSVGHADQFKGKLDEKVEAKLQELLARVHEMLVENRSFIISIAHALLERHTITGEDITAIDLGTLGPIIDGSWYKNPYNLSLIEAFHSGAMTAHAMETPNWEGQVPRLPSLSLPPPPPNGTVTSWN